MDLDTILRKALQATTPAEYVEIILGKRLSISERNMLNHGLVRKSRKLPDFFRNRDGDLPLTSHGV